MLKIHIMGGPGSGKTTLGKEIASRFGLTFYELDAINWSEMIGVSDEIENTDAAYIHHTFTMASQPGWVIEGIYLITTDPFLIHADYVVLLEVPWHTAVYRVVRRHFLRSLHGTNPYPGIRGLCRFVRDVRDYYQNRCNPAIAELISKYLEEHRTSTTPLDAEQLLKRLEAFGDDIVLAPTEEFVRNYLDRYKQKVICVRNNAEREQLFALLAQDQ